MPIPRLLTRSRRRPDDRSSTPTPSESTDHPEASETAEGLGSAGSPIDGKVAAEPPLAAPPSAEATAETTANRRRPGGDFWRGAALAVCAAVSLLLYAIQLAVVPNLGPAEHSFASEVFPAVEPLLSGSLLEIRDGLPRVNYVAIHAQASAQFLLLQFGLFVLYGLALWIAAGRRSLALKLTAFGAGAGFLLIQMAGPATLSSDVFSYIIYGRMHALYGGNPYVETPAQYLGDPFLPLVYWREVPSFYGPVWTLVSGLLAQLGGEQVGLTVLLFRATAAAAALLTGGLIWACLERASPRRAAQGLIFFLWNPLVILESGLSAHNDVLMVSLLVGAVWLHVRRHRAAAVAALTLSALVKFVTLPLIPLYGLLVLRRSRGLLRRARFLVASAAAVAVPLAAVLGLARVGPEVLAVGTLGSGVDRYHNSLHELIFERARLAAGLEPEWRGVPVRFRPWWVMTHASSELWSSPYASAERLGLVWEWTPSLVLAPQEGDWLFVYDTASKQMGYIFAGDAGPIPRPAVVSEEVRRLEAGPAVSQATQAANAAVRLAGLAAFAVLGLLAAWHSARLRSFLVWSVAVLLGFYFLLATWVWPWYIVWALGLAALVPSSRLSGFTAVLSATVLSLYVSHGFQNSSQHWIYEYRSLASFAFPLALFVVSAFLSWLVCAVWSGIRSVPARLRPRVETGAA